MKRRDRQTERSTVDNLDERIPRSVPVLERSPRDEVVEILAEGLWTLICQGRGPAAGRFPALSDVTANPAD
jgi:hypothetical protein